MNQLQKDYNELLNRDALAEAEQSLGLSHHGNDDVAFLGIAKMMDINDKRRAMATLCRDTYFDMPLSDYIDCIQQIGFQKVYHKPFSAMHCGEKRDCEHFMFWENKRGILLHFDTYYGKSINGGKFYYNIKPKDVDNHEWHRHTSSGGLRDGVWAGDHDCREAVKHHIQMLEEYADFLPVWKEDPFLWLLNWSDSKKEGYDYKAINAERISKLPLHIQKAITPLNQNEV